MSLITKIRTSIVFATLVIYATGCINESSISSANGSEGAMAASDKILNTPAMAVEGQLMVCLSAEAVAEMENTGKCSFMQDTEVDFKSIKPIFTATEHNIKYLKKYGLDCWFQVEFDGSSELAATSLAELGVVTKVQYNTVVECGKGITAYEAEPELTTGNDLPFNDPRLADQWHYINNGDMSIATSAVAGADIGVKDVWTKLKLGGDNEIIVAIMDGPVKYDHEDLKENMWSNVLEIAGNKIDDDGNGFVDDIHGWNFEKDTCKINWSDASESGHGTHVAGVVAAVNNNNIGVSGIAGGTGNGDGVRLMSCQIMQGGSNSNINAAAQAFIYAADNGAHILQCSWGYPYVITSDYQYFQNYGVEYFALKYFLDEERFAETEEKLNEKLKAAGKTERTKVIDGPLVIFAAGNDGYDKASYPGALMDCICVTGIGPDGYPASYTNFGPGSNIAAPGGDRLLNTSTSRSQVLSTCVSKGSVKDYAYMVGTSMACPHVSGVAALGLAYVKRLAAQGKLFDGKPYISRDLFKAILLASVNDIDSQLSSGYKYLGTDENTGGELDPRPYTSYQYNMGTGSLDAWKFMMNLEGTPVLTVKMGADGLYDLNKYFGGGSEHMTFVDVDMDAESKESLGLLLIPEIKNGKLSIAPTKVGSGMIKITAIAGGNTIAGSMSGDWTGNGDYVEVPNSSGTIGGMYITREISIVSRGVASKNGGWL